jgi:hypothetical protein
MFAVNVDEDVESEFRIEAAYMYRQTWIASPDAGNTIYLQKRNI